MLPTRHTSFAGISRLLAGAAGVVLIAACAVGPRYQRPDQHPPVAFKHTTPAERSTADIKPQWWTLFGDPALDHFVDELLRENLDIHAAMARVDEARAATRVARAGFLPAVSLDPSIRRSQGNGITSGSGSGRSTTTIYSLPLDVSYEVDIWGRLRRQFEFAQETERASANDLEVVRQTAVADFVQGYFALQLYDHQTTILVEARRLYDYQLSLTRKKSAAGLAPQTDVLQAQNQLDATRTQLLELERSRDKQENALAILLGRPPAEFSSIKQVPEFAVPLIPAGLPAALLAQRPDVAEAEHKLKAANAQVGVAEANFFPQLTLTGSAGFESMNLSGLTNWENRVWSFGPSLSLPIFQGGRLTAQLAGARASYAEIAANYRKAVLTAFREVEDELVDLHSLAREADATEETLQSARENVRLTELQYRQGLTSYLEVITANQTLLNNQLALANVQNERIAATILLIKALGGGWKTGADAGPRS